MDNLEQKAKEYSPKSPILQIVFKDGFRACEKEYEEKLRWIPVEEKLPELREKQYQVESMSVAGTRSQWIIESEHDIESLKGLRIAWRYFL